MKGRMPELGREVPRLEIPDDVAVLYSWANLQGARYRDFSAARRESRAQMRQRTAEAQHADEAVSIAHSGYPAKSQDYADAVGRPDGVHRAGEPAPGEEREIAEVQASADRQAQQGLQEQASQTVATAFFHPVGTLTDPYTPRPQAPPARVLAGPPMPEEDMRPERFPQRRKPRTMVPPPEFAAHKPSEKSGSNLGAKRQESGSLPTEEVPAEPFPAPDTNDQIAAIDHFVHQQSFEARDFTVPASTTGQEGTSAPGAAISTSASLPAPKSRPGFVERRSEPRVPLPTSDDRSEVAVPAWIDSKETAPVAPRRTDAGPPAVMDTLQHSRERVASRWYALRGVFNPATPEMEPMQARAREAASPLLAIFSFAGGVGKTSLTASLGRSLSALGEKVLLADLTPQGILPFYFGATELRPGVMRTFNPPPGSADAPVSMLSYDVLGPSEAGEAAFEASLHQLTGGKEKFQHVLADLGPASAKVLNALARLDATVLVPITPDMNTVIGLASMERFFAGMADSAGRALQPRYLLTQFEATLPLHLDVREGLRQKLSHRLLPFVIRRSSEVSEALAEGMTVIDYAPESGVAADYRNLANWFRLLAAPGQPVSRAARWSER